MRTLSIIAIGVLLGAGYTAFGALLNDAQLGSVDQGSVYQSTQVTSSLASSTGTTQIKGYAGTLGSVVVTSNSGASTTGYPLLVVYDATSTMATATAKVLAKFSTTTQTQGTYQFDTAYSYGLKVEVPLGFTGQYTLTYR